MAHPIADPLSYPKPHHSPGRCPEKVDVVLVCAPSGTKLTKIADKLRDAKYPKAVQDLEARLCKRYTGHPSHEEMELQVNETPTMWHVVRRPRQELFDEWEATYEEALDACITQVEAEFRALCMHLSWYQPSTSEFFSPVSVTCLRRAADQAGCSFSQVVILIDDIYDMFARLQGTNDIYRADAMEKRAERLHALRYSADRTAVTLQRSRIEAIESALIHLISWRQQEILHAESIARELGADFTVLGIKHSMKSFTDLLRSRNTPKTYLSHRISEVRRLNKASNSLPGKLGEWSAVVDEVNSLHFEFAKAEAEQLPISPQLLINPTAIDELRFGGPDENQNLLPYLAKRWTVPKPREDLIWAPASDDNEHTKLLASDFIHPDEVPLLKHPDEKPLLKHPDETASSVARALTNRIYHDVAFRDHVIVEHTPGLCVYRPFFQASRDGDEIVPSDWSGGVKPEILHWYSKASSADGQRRRLAFVHSREEIQSRLAWLTRKGSSDFVEDMLTHLPQLLKDQGINSETADTLCKDIRHARASDDKGSHLAQDPLPTVAQLDSVFVDGEGAQNLLDSLETAYQLAMFSAYTMLDRPQDPAAGTSTFDIYFLIARQIPGKERLLEDLDEVAAELRDFFSRDIEPDILKERERADRLKEKDTLFWRLNDRLLKQSVGLDPIEYCCKLLHLPYRHLSESLGQ